MTDSDERSGRDAFVSEGLDPEQIEELRASVAALRAHISARFSAPMEPEGVERSAPEPLPVSAEPPEPVAPVEPVEPVDPVERLESEGADGSLTERIGELLSELDAWALWSQVRGFLSNLGMRSRSPETDDFGMDPLLIDQMRPLIDFLFDTWWRIQVSGVEEIPRSGAEPVLFVANRSGVLPYDGLMIAHALERSLPDAPRARFLVADWFATLPFAQSMLARLGGVRACRENAERLLRTGRPVIAFPEGQKGALKPFADRYRLQRFGRGGFVSVAVEARAIVVPVAVVGAEEAHPVLFRPPLLERLVGIPVPLTPTFPHLGPLGAVPLPSRWRIRFGAPIRFDEVPPERAEDPLYVNRTRERIRGTVQELLDEELQQRRSVFAG
jgi:1-acyl-sn-glycerol-3-phosphate acyltransferase